MRCVEAWSMVIPWLGFPLGDLIKRLEPTGNAKYVEFDHAARPEADARASAVRSWTGRTSRGCGMDEAMHPLTLMAVGPVRQDAAEPERRAAAAGGALEVRLQGRQVDRQDPLHRRAAEEHLGASRPRTSTASTPTSTRTSTTRAGARRPSGASASSAGARRCRSTATPRRSPASTPAWTCARTSSGGR